nr:X antigen family member 5-like [Macaca nemestrina]
MSWRGRRYRPRRCLRLAQLVGPMPEPSVPEPQQEGPPTESQDHTPGQKREEDQGAAEIQGTLVVDCINYNKLVIVMGKSTSFWYFSCRLEVRSPTAVQSRLGDECGDGSECPGEILPNQRQFQNAEGTDILFSTKYVRIPRAIELDERTRA